MGKTAPGLHSEFMLGCVTWGISLRGPHQMLKNEVGSDVAAPALEKATRNEGLISEFTSALSDSTTLKVVAGTAVIAAGALATVAAIKYGRPALEAGKALGSVVDEGALNAVRGAAKNGELTPMTPATDAIVKNSIPISKTTRAAAAEGNAYVDMAPSITGAESTSIVKSRTAGNSPFSKALQVDEASITRHEIARGADLTPTEPSDAVKLYLQDFGHPANLAAFNPKTAAKELADRMPKPATEADIAAIAGKLAPRIESAQVTDAVAKTTKGA
jgi:hypothetical protein